ncbi:MAG: proteasome-activating nucleotidase, partial [Metallosphaera sp.]
MSDELDLSKDASVNDEHAIRILEEKIRAMQIEAESLRKELNYYKSEMEKLLSPPLIEAVVL